jgi:hypothetical protein
MLIDYVILVGQLVQEKLQLSVQNVMKRNTYYVKIRGGIIVRDVKEKLFHIPSLIFHIL